MTTTSRSTGFLICFFLLALALWAQDQPFRITVNAPAVTVEAVVRDPGVEFQERKGTKGPGGHDGWTGHADVRSGDATRQDS